jgi:two-component system phosphate regulon sensor histidine kinase PhoR
VIQNEANRLGRLIDNILNISRIESGLVKVEMRPQSLAVVVKEAVEVIAPQAAQKRIELTEQLTPVMFQAMADRDMLYQAVLNLLSNAVKYTPEGGRITVRTEVDEARRKVIAPQAAQKRIELAEQLTPVMFQAMADRDMLYQAVLNLLSNAVKYTPEGGRITVRTEVDEARRKVVARVTDTGVGIPAKDLPLVFDKFYRCGANSRMAQGTGLGLALVKQVIETVHRGRMIAESEVGKGSCFGFELDLCE